MDELRFVRSEKAGTKGDTASQTRYGKRTLRLVYKTITDTGSRAPVMHGWAAALSSVRRRSQEGELNALVTVWA